MAPKSICHYFINQLCELVAIVMRFYMDPLVVKQRKAVIYLWNGPFSICHFFDKRHW